MLRVLLLLTFLFNISVQAQSTDSLSTLLALTMNGDEKKRAECAELYTFQELCDKESKVEIRDKLKTSVKIGSSLSPFSCQSASRYINANCASMANDLCKDAYKEMLDSRKEVNSKCDGSDESICVSKTKALNDCNDFFRDNGYDEPGERPDIKEYLEHCPFYAKEEYETSKAEEKELTETLKTYEDAIRDLQKDSLDDSKDYNKEIAELDKEALGLEKQAKEQIAEMDETLEKVKQVNASELSKIKQEISQLTAQMQKAVNSDAVAVRTKTKEHQLNAGIKCYQVGLEAARAEAARLRQGTLSRRDLNGQVSSGGAVGWLKVVANNAYNECMNGGPMAGGMKLVKEQEQMELQRLQAQINLMSSALKSLQEEYKQASSALPKETQKIIQKYMDSTNQLTQQTMLKKQEKSNLMTMSQKKNLQMQMELSQLSQKKAEVSKRLAKAKTVRAASESIRSPAYGDKKELKEISSALRNFQASRLNAHDLCCPTGTPLAGISPGAVCLTDQIKNYRQESNGDSEFED